MHLYIIFFVNKNAIDLKPYVRVVLRFLRLKIITARTAVNKALTDLKVFIVELIMLHIFYHSFKRKKVNVLQSLTFLCEYFITSISM